MNRTKLRIKAFYPNFYEDRLIAYVSLRIIHNFNTTDVSAEIMGLSSNHGIDQYRKRRLRRYSGLPSNIGIYRDAIPGGLIWSVLFRVLGVGRLRSFAEWRFFLGLRKEDVAYLWPETSLRLYKKVKKLGCTIVSERINTLLGTSKQLLDKEFLFLGFPPSHGIENSAIEDELECMRLSDFIFCPSPGVSESVALAGIPQDRVLQTSYGLEAGEILSKYSDGDIARTVTALFVGTICARKGIHLLLEAWKRVNVAARLVMVGRISAEVEKIVSDSLREIPSIRHIEFVADLKPLYAEADFLVLPSIEEGSPLVTYLALGAGIPLVVSSMGAGGIVEDGKEGFIIDPHRIDDLAQAIERLVCDRELRLRMGIAANVKAPSYVWERVSIQRREILMSRLKLK